MESLPFDCKIEKEKDIDIDRTAKNTGADTIIITIIDDISQSFINLLLLNSSLDMCGGSFYI